MEAAAGFIDYLISETEDYKDSKSIYNDILDEAFIDEIRQLQDYEDIVKSLEARRKAHTRKSCLLDQAISRRNSMLFKTVDKMLKKEIQKSILEKK